MLTGSHYPVIFDHSNKSIGGENRRAQIATLKPQPFVGSARTVSDTVTWFRDIETTFHSHAVRIRSQTSVATSQPLASTVSKRSPSGVTKAPTVTIASTPRTNKTLLTTELAARNRASRTERCENGEADRRIDQLLSKGFLYEYDGIRLTNAE
jgi:hypothetical protein